MNLWQRITGALAPARTQIGAVVPAGIEAGALGRRLSTFVPAGYHINTLVACSGKGWFRRCDSFRLPAEGVSHAT